MPKKPITPGQKAARARDRERFAERLAANEAAADQVYERLLSGDRLSRRDEGAYAFADGTAVDVAIVSILQYRRAVVPKGNALVACAPPDAPV